MAGRLRIRDLPALPFLLLLHLCFTLSSLFLRTYELLTNPDTDLDHEDVSNGTPIDRRPASGSAPKHVAMVILPPAAHRRNGEAVATKWSRDERARIVECVLNLAELASEEEVTEVSIYEASGLLEAVKADIMAELLCLPLSPPNSEPRTSSGTHTPSEQLHEVDSSRSSGSGTQVTTFTVFSSTSHHAKTSTSQPTPRRIIMHLLPPSTADIVATVTNSFIKSSIHPEDITPTMLDAGIRAALQFSQDPDLLIVHSLYEPSGWRSWLPRPAPELGGYPFWTLRISEIYHHSPSLPLLSLFKPLLHLARTSTLPFLRKLGRLVPPPPHVRDEMIDLYDGPGRIDREEWAGAMRAWRAVEQRLGR